MRYETGHPDEYLAVTGRGIDGVKLVQKGMIWPFQNAMKFSVKPRDYTLNLNAMTKEKLQLVVPVIFTIGPENSARLDDESEEGLLKYCKLLASAPGGAHEAYETTANIIRGIIEGETRVIVGSMTMEEVCNGRELFKKRIAQGIEGELRQFGLKIYNANIKELTDAPDSDYFKVSRQKAHETANNKAKVDVAHARWQGSVGEAQSVGNQEREIAQIHAETAVLKTERDTDRSKAEALYATRKAAFDRDVNVAQIEATRAMETRDEELRKEVEIKRAQTEIERLRASDVVKATILRESKQQAADAKAYEMQAAAQSDQIREQKAADAKAYKTKIDSEAAYHANAKDAEAKYFTQAKEAEARFVAAQKDAESRLIAAQKEAEGRLVAQEKAAQGRLVQQAKEAEGLAKMADAYGKMSQAFGGPQGLIQYLMIEKGVYGELARANATAVQGMQPKMTIWNTGSNTGSADGRDGNSDPAAVIRNTYQMLPPLMQTIHDQTDITLPAWQFGKLGQTAAAVKEIRPESESGSD